MLPSNQNNRIFLFTGEQSGDINGAHLLNALKIQFPNIHFYGVGGPQMRRAGFSSIMNMEDEFQVMGFTHVLKALPRLLKHFKTIKKEIINNPPLAVIFIDYPGFNMRMAKALRKSGYKGKLIHYICPSIWAWKKARIHDLVKTLDLLLTIFPFEPKYFSNTSLRASFIGHPLANAIQNHCYQDNWKELFSIPSEKKCLALFPGSRHQELESNLFLQLQTFELVQKNYPGTFFGAISVARPDLKPIICDQISKFPHLKNSIYLIPTEYNYELMQTAYVALATSGTITLELAFHKVPTVVIYAISSFNFFLAKHIFRIRLPFYCIVNIVCEKNVYPEIFDKNVNAKQIYETLNPFLKTKELYLCCQFECEKLKKLLFLTNGALKGSEEIKSLIDNN